MCVVKKNIFPETAASFWGFFQFFFIFCIILFHVFTEHIYFLLLKSWTWSKTKHKKFMTIEIHFHVLSTLSWNVTPCMTYIISRTRFLCSFSPLLYFTLLFHLQTLNWLQSRKLCNFKYCYASQVVSIWRKHKKIVYIKILKVVHIIVYT